ncbi:MAG: GAF domain-containing protein [Chloroflexota bacterium]|nr:GAF domain-containing protein [Chloroflexota bacterium]MDQ5864143.1 GAF domain-containing protein [Chloroflexota bacterium]
MQKTSIEQLNSEVVGEDRQRSSRRFSFIYTLRGQLILRTLLPLTLLVVAFAAVGQVGYTQVSESLAKSRDADLAGLEAERVGDHLSLAVQTLQQLASSAVLLNADEAQVFYELKRETIIRQFDMVQVTDPDGKLKASNLAASAGDVLNRRAYESLREGVGPAMEIVPITMKDGRSALVVSIPYIDTRGGFGGMVEGVIYYGSPKLGRPFGIQSVDDLEKGTRHSVSYLVASDGRILWHPDQELVGTVLPPVTLNGLNTTEPNAIITSLNGEQSIIGYAPLNLALLFPRASLDTNWLRWYVVTQERWADIVAPLNSLLSGLLVLALVTMLLAVLLVTRSAGALTRPVAKLVAASQALSAGRLRHRLQVSGPIEIEELARQFNLMARQLQASYAELEAKVSERTAELASANAELQRRLAESVTMQRVTTDLAGTAGLADILQTIAVSVSEMLGTESCLVFLPNENRPGELQAAIEWNVPVLRSSDRIPINQSLSGLAYTTGQVQISNNAANDDRVNHTLRQEMAAHSVLAAPMVSRGHTIGVVTAVNKREGDFTQDDLRLMSVLANQAAVAVERARLYSRTQQQLMTLTTINELSLSVTLSRSLEETLVNGMEHIGKLMGASSALVFLYDQKSNTLNYTAHYNMTPEHLRLVVEGNPQVPVGTRPDHRVAFQEAFVTQKPCYIEDAQEPGYLAQWWAVALRELGDEALVRKVTGQVGALIALPLSVRDTRLGTMTVYFSEPRHFTQQELQLFSSFAKILALAVYNTQLLAQSNKLATVEERARLARELHDSVTQSLFSLNLTLRAARRVLTTDGEQALSLMDNVQELAQGSLAEMRALIFELRPQALQNEGLASALQKHADAVKARNGLVVHLDLAGDRRLPIEHEEALYQIAREALHNVVKHAQASEAWVCLDTSSDHVTLSIRDNGRGFETTKLVAGGGSHIGTSTMRERAQAIGGTISFESKPGEGTEVLVSVNIDPANPATIAKTNGLTANINTPAAAGGRAFDATNV